MGASSRIGGLLADSPYAAPAEQSMAITGTNFVFVFHSSRCVKATDGEGLVAAMARANGRSARRGALRWHSVEGIFPAARGMAASGEPSDQ